MLRKHIDQVQAIMIQQQIVIGSIFIAPTVEKDGEKSNDED
jgi:hypothetical protein